MALLLMALALLSAGGARASDAVASILFQNQCGFEVNIYDGDERFCDLRNGTEAAPSFGCATNLPRELAEYSHTGAANATSTHFTSRIACHRSRTLILVVFIAARFLIDDASNNTYYELSDEPGEVSWRERELLRDSIAPPSPSVVIVTVPFHSPNPRWLDDAVDRLTMCVVCL